ncbi:MAG TPA: PilZ domain-containing protein [Vicinamibacterales bacterium]|nr:PilZ domain-containing protein [Vicinamibacterales bacterium]
MNSGGTRRDDERVPILGALKGEVMVFQSLTVLDISAGGALVETEFPLHVDSLHDFRLTLGDRSVVLKGRIAHCSIGDLEEGRVAYRSGVEFVDPPPHVQAALGEFIESIRATRRSDV